MIILGSTGMLGSMMTEVIPEALTGTIEAKSPVLLEDFGSHQVVNCIGLIKPYCDDVESAIRVNALFPHQLPKGTIQIATDCVFSGRKGNYVETDVHNATDVYGQTKSLGEAPHLKNLRCSIIGPERKHHLSLHDWLLNQEGTVDGYMNHMWNGVTTYHFAKVVQGVIREGIELPEVQHLVPANSVSKMRLLRLLVNAYGKNIRVKGVEAPEPIDRTLNTLNPEMNRRLWKAAGYDEPPTIEQMIRELVQR